MVRFEFWQGKWVANRERDERVTSTLESCGWRVLQVWEHELNKATRYEMADRIREAVEGRVARQAGT